MSQMQFHIDGLLVHEISSLLDEKEIRKITNKSEIFFLSWNLELKNVFIFPLAYFFWEIHK